MATLELRLLVTSPPEGARGSVLDEFDRNPDSPYWALRLVEETRSREECSSNEQRLVGAYALLASYDPLLFIREPSSMYMRFASATQMTFEAIEQVDARAKIADESVEAIVKGMLWTLAGAFRKKAAEPFRRRAVAHLERVPSTQRSKAFWAAYGDALDDLEYERLKAVLDSYLAHADGRGIVKVLVRSSRASDWETFDRVRPMFDRLQTPFGSPHEECAVLNADGLRSLDADDMTSVSEIMGTLLIRGRNVNFLNNPDTMALVRSLVPRDLLLKECLEYVTMAARDGWKSQDQEDFAASIRKTLAGKVDS